MKITTAKLKQIIKEEIENTLNEAHPRDPGGFMGMHISGDTAPIDTSGISFEQTLAEKAIEALESDEDADYDWIIEELEGLTPQQENDEGAVNDILSAQLGTTLEDLL